MNWRGWHSPQDGIWTGTQIKVCYDRVTRWYEEQGNPRNARVVYTKHTSSDQAQFARKRLGADAVAPKDFSDVTFVHTAGTSIWKGTKQLLDCWTSTPGLPPLDLYANEGSYNYLMQGAYGKWVWWYSRSTVNLHFGMMDRLSFSKLTAEAAFFMCPSLAEGYGHCINQARAAGAVIVTTDAPPMNELILSSSMGVLVPTRVEKDDRMMLGGNYSQEHGLKNADGLLAAVTGDDICESVKRMMKSLREHLLVPIDDLAGQRAQLVYAPNEHLRMFPFAHSRTRLMLYCALAVASWGSLLIVSVWYPQIFTRLARVALPCAAEGDADYMLIHIHGDGLQARWVECAVHHPAPSGDDYRTKVPWVWFEFKRQRYVFNYERGEFRRYLATIREDLGKLQRRSETGLDEHVVRTRRELYGANRITIDAPSTAELLFVKLVRPFYLFQIFSIVVWLFKDYTKYAMVILTMSTVSLAYEIYSEVSNNNRLRRLVRSNRHFQVLRGSTVFRVHESELVPGDVIFVSEGIVCADMLLLSGGCTADEASLTGEAVPVNKEATTGVGHITEASARDRHRASFLQAGSTVIRVYESDAQCKGVVVSTGFSTGKGELFRSILFPKQITFEFERDSYRYLVMLWAVAIAAFIKRLVDGFHVGNSFSETLVDSLDLITVAVPPALPLVLTSGIGFSMHRLYRRGILCIDSQRVNSCGQLSCFCFDKTGTLTQEHLSFAGVAITGTNSTQGTPSRFTLGMATCHGLSEYGGAFQGYSLDLAMFKASHYTIEFFPTPPNDKFIAIVTAPDGINYGIISRFAFDATCQRSSAVVEEINTGKQFVFVKGSPEAVSAISTATPPDLKHKTLSYSTDGYYCIGFGVKELNPDTPIDVSNRDDVENAVEFEGLALFKNELKPETKSMLDELYVADIDVRVITGDNALTAVHVCRELEMKMKTKVAVVDVDEHTGDTVFVSVDDVKKTDVVKWSSFNRNNMNAVLAEFSLAITGAALDKLLNECGDGTVRRIIQQTPVFARVRPQQKAWIVE
ncbi:hypothetical protein PF003_g36575 [Phytophthora fragariae]|nr:hypothetical protein PF003_g36575 [Phytophthora fragariae]